MNRFKVIKALLIAALVFLFTVAFAACSFDENVTGGFDDPDNVTQPEDINGGNGDSDDQDPSIPEEPVDPDTPVDPDAPDIPVDPDPPIDSDIPDDPEEPADPDIPVDPDTPVDPDVPIDPDTPVEPDVPIDPDTPIDPEIPIDPELPVDPDNPDIPDVKPETFTYTVLYGLTLNESATFTVAAGSSIDLSAVDYAVEFYNVSAWEVNGQSVRFPYHIDRDTEFIVRYSRIEYMITYVANGGGNNVRNPLSYNVESGRIDLYPIEKHCFAFAGWHTDAELTQRVESIFYPQPHEITLYAGWQGPAHSFGENHVCEVCGESADPAHVYDTDHNCTVCGAAHADKNHAYDETHTCAICKQKSETAEHEFDAAHTCTICGYGAPDKEHQYGADYLCTVCGAPHGESEHSYNAAHACTVCGKPHANVGHIYGDDYLCSICGISHDDPAHVYNNAHICIVCGKPHQNAEHTYDDEYYCTICGREYDGVRAWTGDIAEMFAAGDGTVVSPFEIDGGAELALLAKLVNGGASDIDGLYSEKYYILTSDIDLGGREFAPIGKGFYNSVDSFNTDFAFKGHLLGNGKEVRNFKITDPDNALKIKNSVKTYYSAGLFGAICGGTVENLRLSEFSIDIVSAETKTVYNVGGVAGLAVNNAAVSYCRIDGHIGVNVNGAANVGMAVGYSGGEGIVNAAELTNVCVYGTVTVRGTNQTAAGGMTGSNGYGQAEKCYAAVTVCAESDETAYGAGLIGYYQNVTHVDHCYALGDVTVKGRTANVDGFLYKTVADKWIKNCLRLDTQKLVSNGKPTAGKTNVVLAATAEEIAEAASSLFDRA